jgi:gas vesicle protein
MEEEKNGINISRQVFMMALGSLVGVALALLYAPSSGENTRRYLRMRTEQARRRAHDITGRIKENIDNLIEDVKETTDEIIAEGVELTKDKKAELLAAIEAGKKTIEEEKKRLEQLGSEEDT